MIKLLPILILLSGCSTAAIQVTEATGVCEITGTVFTPTIREQEPPDIKSQYDFIYQGDNCDIHVWNTVDE